MTSYKSFVFVAAANIALGTLVLGCGGHSVPQRSAEGGILSGTNVERQKYAQRRNPLLTGNAPEEVSATPRADSPLLSPPTPRSSTPAGPASPAGAADAPAPPDATTPAPDTTGPAAPPAGGTGTGTDTGTTTPPPGASESGGTNPPGGTTSGTVTGGAEPPAGGTNR